MRLRARGRHQGRRRVRHPDDELAERFSKRLQGRAVQTALPFYAASTPLAFRFRVQPQGHDSRNGRSRAYPHILKFHRRVMEPTDRYPP
ncbi:hypothetical protein MPLA_580002 [Mesorhizobium sp. ORS 3359]|nr:hypothetical protein MPLA_580002 [Mesorhizobium sp. ORS 3359]